MMGVSLQAGPISLLAMSQLDWEKTLLKDKRRPESPRGPLMIGVGPVRIHAEMPEFAVRSEEATDDAR